jgi:hypothetical protein
MVGAVAQTRAGRRPAPGQGPRFESPSRDREQPRLPRSLAPGQGPRFERPIAVL